jgi:hypothetical protein
MIRTVIAASRLVVLAAVALVAVGCVDAEFGGEVGEPRIVFKKRPTGFLGEGGELGGDVGGRGGGVGPKPGSGLGGDQGSPGAGGGGPESPANGGSVGIGGDGEEHLPSHIPVIDPDYEGLDSALVPDMVPVGCLGGYDPENQHLTIQLNAEVFGVRLHATTMGLFANDVLCEDTGGQPLDLNKIKRIEILGGEESNVVIFDFSKGEFGETLMTSEGGFYLDVAGGTDHLLLRGSEAADEFYAGSDTDKLMMSLSSVARINVWAEGFDRMTASLGPGDDKLVPIERLNIGLFDVDTKAPVMAEVLSLPIRLWGGTGNDQLVGSSQRDFIGGGEGDDDLSGLEGSDVFEEDIAANGADLVNGGPDLDEISYRFRIKDLTVQLCQAPVVLFGCLASACDCGDNNGESGEGDTLVNLEIARTGAGDDRLLGSPGDDYLYGEAGNDILNGFAGSDVLQGGKGEDEFDGGDNEDICDNDQGEPALSCEI